MLFLHIFFLLPLPATFLVVRTYGVLPSRGASWTPNLMTNLLPARETIFDFKELFLPIWKPLILVTSKRVRTQTLTPDRPYGRPSHFFYGAVVGATTAYRFM